MIQDNVNMTDTVSFNKVCLPVKKVTHVLSTYSNKHCRAPNEK